MPIFLLIFLFLFFFSPMFSSFYLFPMKGLLLFFLFRFYFYPSLLFVFFLSLFTWITLLAYPLPLKPESYSFSQTLAFWNIGHSLMLSNVLLLQGGYDNS